MVNTTGDGRRSPPAKTPPAKTPTIAPPPPAPPAKGDAAAAASGLETCVAGPGGGRPSRRRRRRRLGHRRGCVRESVCEISAGNDASFSARERRRSRRSGRVRGRVSVGGALVLLELAHGLQRGLHREGDSSGRERLLALLPRRLAAFGLRAVHLAHLREDAPTSALEDGRRAWLETRRSPWPPRRRAWSRVWEGGRRGGGHHVRRVRVRGGGGAAVPGASAGGQLGARLGAFGA